ncbi:phosphopantetheine binding protein [Alteromonadaceae bacterium 2753L.S.0a.02]|nr:phosphopantetheine binding protein [Alteromonadaceae bacterium 2753L.S.0a.02]
MEKVKIRKMLIEAIVEVSPFSAAILQDADEKLTKETYLVDLGINSIDYAHIATILLEKLDISLPLDVFTKTNNVSDVVELFYSLSEQNSAFVH